MAYQIEIIGAPRKYMVTIGGELLMIGFRPRVYQTKGQAQGDVKRLANLEVTRFIQKLFA